MNEKRIFFFDIDGTLYDPTIDDFPDSTKRAIRELSASGNPLYIATSRGEPEIYNVRHILDQYPFDGFIFAGGAITKKHGRYVDEQYMDAADVAEIMKICEQEQIVVRWQGKSELFFDRIPPQDTMELVFSLFGEVPGVRRWNGENVLRMLLYATEKQMQHIACSTKQIEVMPLSSIVYDVMRQGVDKSSAMCAHAAREGFAREQIVAFGDGDNDATMLEKAGIGIAMGNAKEGAKIAADYVTAPILDDGIYTACRHFGWVG